MKRLFNRVIIGVLLSAVSYCTLSAESEDQQKKGPGYTVLTGSAEGRQERIPINSGERVISVQQGKRTLGVQRISSGATRVIIGLEGPSLAQLTRDNSIAKI